MGKISKGFNYLGVRFYELRICIKEFLCNSKLSKDSYIAYLENGLLVQAHSIEKGLGLKNTKPGHSSAVVIALLKKLIWYKQKNYDTDRFAFRESLRILIAYVDFQMAFNTENFHEFDQIKELYDELAGLLGDDYINVLKKELNAGSYVLDKDDLLEGTKYDFASFISTRHSIRMYENKPISEEEIKEAVNIANLSPSACNRQPNKVYFCGKPDKVSIIDTLITGSSGFKGETPNYIIVTTDRACFSEVEQFQWYINGGIYVSYLTLALHSIGIGSCIMQWKAFYKTQDELKALFGIKRTEAIIAVVGCGYYTDNTRCIAAQRKDYNESLSVL